MNRCRRRRRRFGLMNFSIGRVEKESCVSAVNDIALFEISPEHIAHLRRRRGANLTMYNPAMPLHACRACTIKQWYLIKSSDTATAAVVALVTAAVACEGRSAREIALVCTAPR